MATNIIQLPFQYEGEPLSTYRERMAFYRDQRRWLTKPERIPTTKQRAEIATWQEKRPALVVLPLFAFADRRVS